MAEVESFLMKDGSTLALLSWKGVEAKLIIKDDRLYGCPKFHELFPSTLDLRIPLAFRVSVDSLLKGIAEALALSVDNKTTRYKPDVGIDRSFLSDLEAIGWKNVVEVKVDKNLFIFELPRGFTLSIQNQSLALEPFVDFVSLPSIDGSKSLYELYKACSETIHALEPFFKVIEVIESEFNVESPSSRWSQVRRFMIQRYQYITITFDPSNIYTCPSASKPPVCPWNPSASVIDNLCNCFEIPRKGQINSIECGVCSSAKGVDNKEATFACSNMMCQQIFHETCLRDWFHSDPRSVKSFGSIHGFCPFCEHKTAIDIDS